MQLNIEFNDAFSCTADQLQPRDVIPLELPQLETTAIPIRLQTIEVKTVGYQFPRAGGGIQVFRGRTQTAAPENNSVQPLVSAQATKQQEQDLAERLRTARQKIRTGKITRIKPPADVVKLEDRLFYLLQPPLELLVGSEQLDFPFDPFPYQLDGIAFLFSRYAAVLADEMGLGKTMQAISTIRLLLCSGEVRSVLLICPKPLVTNWLREFSVWAPEVPVAPIEGNSPTRQWQWTSPDIAVKIANYELLMRDRDAVLDQDQHFDLVVLDEAQRIKNQKNATSAVVREISRTRSWALTGTPVENAPEDLVGIFEFLSPGYLNVDMPMATLAKSTRDYMLRRTKDMVLSDMPPKLYRDATLDLTAEQQSTYERAENEGIVQLENLNEQLTIQHVFELVLRLKQICNFDPVTGSSAKLERLVADMEEVAACGHKAIVFSQWVNSIDAMRPALERFGPLEYHGRVPHKQRDGVIAQFKSDPSKHVILMSYGAGSVDSIYNSVDTFFSLIAGGIQPSKIKRSTAPIALGLRAA